MIIITLLWLYSLYLCFSKRDFSLSEDWLSCMLILGLVEAFIEVILLVVVRS